MATSTTMATNTTMATTMNPKVLTLSPPPSYESQAGATGGYNNYGYNGPTAAGAGGARGVSNQHVIVIGPRSGASSDAAPMRMTTMGLEPKTTCALVMSVISAIFCLLWCGTLGILVAWQARLQVLEKKWDQARHSLKIVWVLFGIAMLFGAAFWGSMILLIVITSRPTDHYYPSQYPRDYGYPEP